jgi:hypothetical protein
MVASRFSAVESDLGSQGGDLSEEEVLLPVRPLLRLVPDRSPTPVTPRRSLVPALVAFGGGAAVVVGGAVALATLVAGAAVVWVALAG